MCFIKVEEEPEATEECQLAVADEAKKGDNTLSICLKVEETIANEPGTLIGQTEHELFANIVNSERCLKVEETIANEPGTLMDKQSMNSLRILLILKDVSR